MTTATTATVAAKIDVQGMGGFLSVGDLDGDGHAEYVVTQGTRHLAAFDEDGTLLWRKSRPQYGQVRVHVECEMPTCVYDIDGDGRAEILARWYLEDSRDAVPFLMILDGGTGEIRHLAALPLMVWPESVLSMAHSGGLVVGQIEHDQPPHLILGGMCWGLAIFDHQLRLRFCEPQLGRIHDRMTGFGLSHTPQLFDIDGDRVNELFLGQTTCRADGTELWTINCESFSPTQIDHVDSLAVADLNNDGRYELAVSNAASVFDAHTGDLRWQRPETVRHGQQLRVGRVSSTAVDSQIVIVDGKGDGHTVVLSADGDLLATIPMGAQLELLNWSGNDLQQLLIGHQIYDGDGELVAALPITQEDSQLPGRAAETWGHATTCDVDDDGLEEVIWVNRDQLLVFKNPAPINPPRRVSRDHEYWMRVANATRY